MSKTYSLQIPRQLYDAMLAQAVAELPNECCGLLAGTPSDDVGRVTHRFPLVNVASDRTVEYFGEGRGLVAAHRAARDLGAEIIAIYHSHPTTHAVPSATDHERNWHEPSMVFLIISLAVDPPDVRAWRLTATDATEVALEVVTELE